MKLLILISQFAFAQLKVPTAFQSCYNNYTVSGSQLGFLRQSQDIYDSINCKDFSEGETRLFDLSERQSPSGVQHRYTIQKRGDQFIIKVNPIFKDGRSNPSKDMNTENAIARFKNCLSQFNEIYLGKNGQSLKVELFNSENDQSFPPGEVTIGIGDKGYRSHSEKYAEDLDCPGVLHETLHLLGLVDEYDEPNRNLKGTSIYNCRYISKNESVMSKQNLAVRRSQYKVSYDWAYCSCEPGPDFKECQQTSKKFIASRRIYGTSCPRGFTQSSWIPGKSEKGEAAFRQDIEAVDKGPGVHPFGTLDDSPPNLTIYKNIKPLPIAEQSILSEEQFNAIVYPGCLSKNRAYYFKAKNAYAFSSQGTKCIPGYSEKSDR